MMVDCSYRMKNINGQEMPGRDGHDKEALVV